MSDPIVGIATAICLGGYGAVFWMWVIALIPAGVPACGQAPSAL